MGWLCFGGLCCFNVVWIAKHWAVLCREDVWNAEFPSFYLLSDLTSGLEGDLTKSSSFSWLGCISAWIGISCCPFLLLSCAVACCSQLAASGFTFITKRFCEFCCKRKHEKSSGKKPGAGQEKVRISSAAVAKNAASIAENNLLSLTLAMDPWAPSTLLWMTAILMEGWTPASSELVQNSLVYLHVS